MKAISLKQPWANLVAEGKKTIETRTWETKHRGDILIVSSKSPTSPEPVGMALAIAEIIDCRPMTVADENAACCKIYPRAHAWTLRNIRKITPFPVKGSLGIYNVDLKKNISLKTKLH
jgi:ASCH domain